MNTLIAIRLDESLENELNKKAIALGVSKSKLVRDALVDYLPKVKAVKAPVAKKAAKKAPVKATKPVVRTAAKKVVKTKKK